MWTHPPRKESPMKVKTTILLDDDVKKVVTEYCAKMGMSLSGFLNAILGELVNDLKGQPVKLDRPIQDLTIKEFGELASYWMQKVSE